MSKNASKTILNRIAFVAMRFDTDPWRDKRFIVIKEVLEEAGYKVVRADMIQTSGTIVEEVCKLLREADLIVIDSTGDSHSVSYELGFCHGIGRSHDSLILVRKGDGNGIPFNYRHFRHRCYRDVRHLRRLLREWFELSRPIPDTDCAYAIILDGPVEEKDYSDDVASAILQVIKNSAFSGRLEYYSCLREMGNATHYCVGLGLRRSRKPHSVSYEEWTDLVDSICKTLSENGVPLTNAEVLSELGLMTSLRASFPLRGVVEFDDGNPLRIIAPRAEWSQSPICVLVDKLLGHQHGIVATPDSRQRLVIEYPNKFSVVIRSLPINSSNSLTV